MDIYEEIIKAKSSSQPFVLATVVESLGSSPREAGAKMIIKSDGSTVGSIGGGAVEKTVMEEAKKLMGSAEPKLFQYNLSKDLGMQCGGKMSIFLEPFLTAAKLYIFGAGHIGTALTTLGDMLGFAVTVVDNRPEYANQQRLPLAQRVLADEYSNALNELTFDENTYIVIVTHGHAHDEEILRYCARQKFKYLGMIGSRNKVKKALDFLRQDGIPEDVIDNIHAPIGIDIGADTPAEIAVAIAAELVAVKTGTPVKRAKSK